MGVQMSVRGGEEVRICCAVCIWENYPLASPDSHRLSLLVYLYTTGCYRSTDLRPHLNLRGEFLNL